MNKKRIVPAVTGKTDGYIWVTKFTQASLKEFYSQFIEMEADPSYSMIVIIIDSYGGYAQALLAMRDIIKSSSKPVSTIAMSHALSCGALLLAAGTKGYRFMAPSAWVLVHQVSAGVYGKVSDMINDTKNIVDSNRIVFENLAEDIGVDVSKIYNKMKDLHNSDWHINAKEAKDWGFVDHIGVPRPIEQSSIVGLKIPASPKPKKR